MATFKQAIERALQSDQMKLLSVNQNMIEVAAQTKKKAAFVKVATTEDLARGLLHREKVAFILHIDGDVMNEIVKQLDEEETTKEEVRAIHKDGFDPLDEETKEIRKKIIATMREAGRKALVSNESPNEVEAD